MRVVACIPLHYGREYLAYAVRGIASVVDEVHAFYSPTPTYGHGGGIVCPDTEDDLKREAERFHRPVYWHVIQAGTEGEHRDHMLRVARERGADIVFPVDADEVWDPEAARASAEAVYRCNRAGRWLCSFLHLWRSFNWVVEDGFRPIRVVDLRHSLDVDESLSLEDQRAPILHFSCAQSEVITRYKWTCHGHQSELRPGWLDRFFAWQPGDGDTHPTVNNLWTPRPVTEIERALIEKNVGDHPYAKVERI